MKKLRVLALKGLLYVFLFIAYNCYAYIREHEQTIEEYWVYELEWGIQHLKEAGIIINSTNIGKLLSFHDHYYAAIYDRISNPETRKIVDRIWKENRKI